MTCSDRKLSAKEIEEKVLNTSCMAAESVGQILGKIKKELCKAGLLALGIKK